MNRLKYIILSMLCLCALSVQADDTAANLLANDVKKLRQENDELKEKIKKLEKDKEEAIKKATKDAKKILDDSIKNKNKTIGKLTKEINELNKKLEKSEEKNKKNKIEELKSKNDSLKNGIDTLRNNYERQLEDLNTELNELKTSYSELKKFSVYFITHLANSPNEWENKLYSEIDLIDMKNLDKDIKQFGQFSSEDDKIKIRHDELEKLLSEVQVYQRGDSLINNPYDKEAVNKAIDELNVIKPSNKERGKEIKSLQEKLNNYGITIEIFQDVIKSVDKVVEGESAAYAVSLASNKIDRLEKDNGFISAIKAIPWLKKMYDEYYNVVSTNPKGDNPAKVTIMEIKP